MLLKLGYILLAIIILLLMIVIHEFGHYVAGKLLKFKINEFSVGFGPKIISKTKKNGEKFSLRAIPLGGYCAFEGDESEVGENGTVNDKAFVNEKPYKRIIVFLAGAIFNLISAVLFSFIFILVIGFAVPKVGDVYANPNNGLPYNSLIKGDKIIAVDGKKISVLNSFEELVADVKVGENVVLRVERNGKIENIKLSKQQIESEGETYDGFGFISERIYEKAGVGTALVNSVPFTGKLSWSLLGAFGKIITGKIALSNLSGPIGTVNQMADLAHESWRNILILLPLIASNLAVFNLLPIPALDGSKIIFTTVEWIRRKPINRNIENIIHFAGLVLLFGFVIIIDLIGIFT